VIQPCVIPGLTRNLVQRKSRPSGGNLNIDWIPAFAGMTGSSTAEFETAYFRVFTLPAHRAWARICGLW